MNYLVVREPSLLARRAVSFPFLLSSPRDDDDPLRFLVINSNLAPGHFSGSQTVGLPAAAICFGDICS